MSTVNFSELISVLARSGIHEREIEEITSDLIPEIIPFTKDIAVIAGKLITTTSQYGLSSGDRACIATAIARSMRVYTTDQVWAKLELNCEVILMR